MSRKFTHNEIVQIAYKWVLKNCSCGVAFKEFRTAACNGEYPDVIGFSSGPSTLVEVKVSRSDFLADKSKHFRSTPELGMGDYRYYCCPEGLITPEELPAGWGLVYVNEKGKATCKVRPIVTAINTYGREYKTLFKHPKNIRAEHGLMYSALRRLHLRGRIEEVYTDPSEIITSNQITVKT